MLTELGPQPFIAGFTLGDCITADGVRIRFARGGSGPPLLLLHGHPQTHITWRKIAPALARHFTVIAPDLRGYGDSAKLQSDAAHAPYAKRAMADDQMALMAAHGFSRFRVIGHDRGGRVAHRLCLDHPDAVSQVAMFDLVPTAAMYGRADQALATRYFWWFFLIQPEPLPETLIGGDPAFFLRRHIGRQLDRADATEEAAFAEYLRCYSDPQTRHAICEDYRAGARIDLTHDAEDRDRRITAPLLALWGARGGLPGLFDVLGEWRARAGDVRGRAMPCGHTPQEECPDETLAELAAFFGF
ncbi:MAG: alpha/beta hydrolase [Rhodospirillales bacterium]|nr:alpha/beta hydrolase [Rhodospirillales bacterium]